MYQTLIFLHSITRWLLLAALLFSLFRSWRGWLKQTAWLPVDNFLRSITVTLAHIQLVIGVWLYFESPLIDYFYDHFSEAVKNRNIRFFGMEHSLMMAVAVTLITIGASKARRRAEPVQKFKAMAIWCTLALVIIFVSIPWPFSPMAARPWLRTF